MKKRERRGPRSQPRVRGKVRTACHTAVEDRIERWIAREQARYNVSRSFVIAVACAYAAGLDLEDWDYHNWKGKA